MDEWLREEDDTFSDHAFVCVTENHPMNRGFGRKWQIRILVDSFFFVFDVRRSEWQRKQGIWSFEANLLAYSSSARCQSVLTPQKLIENS